MAMRTTVYANPTRKTPARRVRPYVYKVVLKPVEAGAIRSALRLALGIPEPPFGIRHERAAREILKRWM